MCHYEAVVEHISEMTEPLDGIGVYSKEQTAEVFDTAFELADAVRENDPASGVLLRAAITKLTDNEDDGTAMCLLLTMNSIIEALR